MLNFNTMPTLKDITEEIIIEGTNPTSIFRHAEKFMVDKYAKEGLKKLNLTFARSVKGMNITVPISCRVGKPSDFMQFIRAYVINCDGRMIEISRSKNVPEKIFHFLLDCDGSVLEDCDGSLTDDCLLCNDTESDKDPCEAECFCTCTPNRIPRGLKQLIADIEQYQGAWIAEHENGFEFSGDLEGVKVVIEYMSNDVNEIDQCNIKVPEELGECLEYYIKYKVLEGDMNLMNQSQYFRKEFKRMRDLAFQSSSNVTEMDLKKLFLMK